MNLSERKYQFQVKNEFINNGRKNIENLIVTGGDYYVSMNKLNDLIIDYFSFMK